MAFGLKEIGLFLVLLFVPTVMSVELKSPESSFPTGDYRNCLSQLGKNVDIFEVLPIHGWDNLRNLETGVVIFANYSKCMLTDDGKYLIPDDVYLIPLKMSKVHEFAELITHWTNYSSVTSKSINVDGGLNIFSFGISGKFSDSYQNTKTKQVYDKSYTTRVQLRYIQYTAKLQPFAPLHPSFKSALLKIARFIQMNQTDDARYQSELLVRDFGTHVVTSIDAGAALVQEDFVTREFIMKYESKKHDILAAASANFFGIAHLGITHTSSSKNTMSDSYDKSKTSSDISTYGGSIYMFANYTATDWAGKLDNNLVAMDRSGDPLYYVITPDNLPEVPVSIVREVADTVQKSIERYFEYNIYRGCLSADAPNFAFQANVEDGSCKLPLTNLTFGGVYQVCQMTAGSNAGDLCGGLSQDNPKTGQYSCPSNYRSVQLHSETFKKSYTTRPCHHCGWWSRCCHTEYHLSKATVTTYWCAADHSVPQDSGYLFGGMYSSHIANPFTKGKDCPANYYPRMVGSDLKVCISDDFEMASKDSVPFGGFYSCDMGNPLAVAKSDSSSSLKMSPLNTLKEYYRKRGASGWPKGCPKGFSAHLGIIDQECAIHYCIVSGALSPKGLPPIRRPPFSNRAVIIPAIETDYIFNINNGTWARDIGAMEISNTPAKSEDESSSMNPGVASVISILGTLGFVGLIIAVLAFVRHRRTSQSTYGGIGQEHLVNSQSGYGSTVNANTAEQNC
ncbi:macrophage-expressed gene 1 protein [Patella vulgata]|uniref:macrophage-expressed gene 1 protein n=1 Tax=Patella vulgata TaxID=6465 RepID=UPI002180688A|nr:macrophage-expressed gene 1 protein [Patella vulgata]